MLTLMGKMIDAQIHGAYLLALSIKEKKSNATMDRIFEPPFSMTGAISQDRESCQFLFWLMKNPLLYRSARPGGDREARERFLMEPLARTLSERRRRLALASGFRLSDYLE
jgi:hypothetical protein